MGKKSKTGVLKRLREVKKAEKAAMKREQLKERKDTEEPAREKSSRVATDEDMAGYGFPSGDEPDQEGEEGSRH
jgi:hypothetical protein